MTRQSECATLIAKRHRLWAAPMIPLDDDRVLTIMSIAFLLVIFVWAMRRREEVLNALKGEIDE